MKVSKTLMLSCAMVGAAALPALAQGDDLTSGTVGTQVVKVASAVKPAPNNGAIRMAPISVLSPSARGRSASACQTDATPFTAERAKGASIGVFIPTDAPGGVDANPGFTLDLERIVTSGDKTSVVVSLRYTHYTYDFNAPGLSGSGDVNLVNPMVEYRYRLGANRRFYLAPGIGIVFRSGGGALAGGSSTDTNFAYSLAGGYDFQNNIFVDARYVSGGNSADRGIILSVGGHF